MQTRHLLGLSSQPMTRADFQPISEMRGFAPLFVIPTPNLTGHHGSTTVSTTFMGMTLVLHAVSMDPHDYRPTIAPSIYPPSTHFPLISSGEEGEGKRSHLAVL